jgi:hypothetical protein
MRVAEAAVAALGEQHALVDLGQVGDHRLFVLVEDLGPHGDAQDDVVPVLAGAVAAHAGLAVLGEEMLLVAEVDERVEPVDRDHPDVAAAPAVARRQARRTRRTSRAGSSRSLRRRRLSGS